MAVTKKIVYINRRAPHGSIYAQEGLELVLVSAVFDQLVTMIFLDDGVFQLKKNQNTEAIEIKNFSRTYLALADYDVKNIYVERESLESRGLTGQDLMVLRDESLKSLINVVSELELREIMDQADVILNF